jgi:uncharacterized DUF497 family protein/uncharacterized protein (DUF4415 family)
VGAGAANQGADLLARARAEFAGDEERDRAAISHGGRAPSEHAVVRGRAWRDHACRSRQERPHLAGMEFEWDGAKSRRNLAKYGISFDDAARVFSGRMLREVDDRRSYSETRFRAYGMVAGRLLCVVYTVRGDRVRIISAREPALPKDERIVKYSHENLPKGQTDWKRVDQLTDQEIEAAIGDDPDAAPISDEEWFAKAQPVIPPHLKHLFVQIDEDLMAWFRQQGKDWPARINAALREYIERQPKKRKKAG